METKQKRRADGSSRKPAANRPRAGTKTASHTGQTAKRPPKAPAENKKRTQERPKTQRKPLSQRRRTTRPQPSADVIYTQPGPFNKGRFVLNLLIVGAVVLALVFGMSIFFKVDLEKVTVSGANKYTELQIRDAAGLKDGENLLSISEPRIANNIQEALPYVYKVRVGIKLPDTVKIEIVELDVVYSVECVDGSWWLIRSDGVIVERTNDADAGQHTKILGVKIADPVQGEKANASQPVETTAEGETVPVTVLAQEQLTMAISIVEYMEDCGIIGEATSVDVTNLTDLQIWYGERFQILLGDGTELNYKIRTMQSTLTQMGDYQGGVLDISFTTWPNEVGYTPFS